MEIVRSSNAIEPSPKPLNLKASKSSLRRAIVRRILAMDGEVRRLQEAALVARFPGLPGLAESRAVLLYASAFPEEFETRPLLRQVLDWGKLLILPRVDPSTKTLQLCLVSNLDRDLVRGHRGIPEPSEDCPVFPSVEVDWALVPGLGFDVRGYRLGRGAGHYDKLLPTLRVKVPRWALLLDTQWVEELPIEPHDQPLDGLADHRLVIVREPSRG